MPPKRPSLLDNPPAGFSSDEEDTTTSEEEDTTSCSEEEDAFKEGTSCEEEEDEQKVDFKLTKSAHLPSSSASATDEEVASKSKSESESESGSESESESDAEVGKKVKPIALKPREETPKRQKLGENGDMMGESSYGNLASSETLNELIAFNKNWGGLRPTNYVVTEGMKLIEGSKRAELDDRWKQLHLAELELSVQRAKLKRDLLLEAYKSSSK